MPTTTYKILISDLVNVAAQHNDPKSILSLYRCLIQFRRKTPALNRGSFRSVDVPDKNCFVYIREHDNNRYLITLNFGDKHISLDLSNITEDAQMVVSTKYQPDKSEKMRLSNVPLMPHEGIIWKI